MKRVVLIAVFASLAVPTSPARAGFYDVLACDAAPSFVNNAWRQEVTHGWFVAFNACPSHDDQMRGLGARTSWPHPSGTTVPTGASARWIFDAPPGAGVVGIRANAYFEQKGHRYTVGLVNGAGQLLEGCPAMPSDTGGSCGSRLTVDEYVPIWPTHRISSEVTCVYGPCSISGDTYRGWSSLTWVSVTIADNTLPGIGNPRGPLWTDGWTSGVQQVVFDAGDNTGIREVRALVDGRVMAQAGRGCDVTVTRCPDWPDAALDVATTNGVADGRHTLTVETVDRAGNVGSASREIKIDNTPPAAPQELSIDGGDGWRSANGFTIRWRNPEQAAAPIAAAEYRLCPVSGPTSACVSGKREATGISEINDLKVPKEGEWTLTLWLRDAAGNARPETAAEPLQLHFDAGPPTVEIEPQDPQDPARVRVRATDAVSGIARGELELRRQGGKSWRSMPVTLEPGGFSGMIEDERLRDGVYDLRVRAWDAAGNERSSDRRDGEAARLTLPLRVKTRLQVGKKRRVVARRAKRRRVRIVYVRKPAVDLGRKLKIGGRLTAPGGNPLADVEVEVAARVATPGVQFQPVATLRTSKSGRFRYVVPAGPSRIVRFRYAGALRIRSQTKQVHVRVLAASTISVDRKRVVNGEAVTFRGKLRGAFLPASGKLMELQFFDRGKWRTFRTFRASGQDGTWEYSYRFDGTRGTRTYRFRIRVPRENGYPYATGRSRRVAVTVRGL